MATATASPRTKSKTSTNVKFRPLDDRIMIEVREAEETTAGGIVLPDTAREKPQRGTVIAVGPGKLLDSGKRGEMAVRVGMELLYGKYSGTEIDVNGETYVVLRESDVLGIVE